MPKKEKRDIVEKIYQHIVTYPGHSNKEIAEDLNVTPYLVGKTKKDIIGKIDYILAHQIATQFLTDFQVALDSMKRQFTKLENIQADIETDIKTGWRHQQQDPKKEDGYKEIMKNKRPLDSLDKLELRKELAQIERQKTDLWIKIMSMVSQPQAINIMKLIRDKTIILPNNGKLGDNTTMSNNKQPPALLDSSNIEDQDITDSNITAANDTQQQDDDYILSNEEEEEEPEKTG